MFRFESLIHRILQDQIVSWRGIHGLSHWGRVYENGMRLSDESGASRRVVELFAFFHDSQRFNDGTDTGHGHRGAEYAKTLRGEYFDLPDDEFEMLYVACRDHTDEVTHEDVTIQTCWDSDRLDLGRVGMTPDPEFLSTDVARRRDTIHWAHSRAVNEAVPEIVSDLLFLRGGLTAD
ncbi:MAG: HD domain-containing protein [Planctomycetota bacterium]